MLLYLFIGILGTAIIVFAILLSKERKNNREQFFDLNKSLAEGLEKIQQDQQTLSETIGESLYTGLEKVNDLLNDAKEETDKKFQSTERAIQESAEESRNLVSESNAELNRKVELLTTALAQISKENAELRKKLEFFTEIDEDSKNINEDDDAAEREALIQQALRELSKNDTTGTTIGSSEEGEKTEQHTGTDIDEEETPASSSSDTLDDEQKEAFRIMETTSENLFITGKAGTGKSFLLEMFVRGTTKSVIVLAPTGIAALNVGGATIHATFGFSNLEELGVEDINIRNIRLKSEKREVLKNIDAIIIDEISMVRADTFDKIDKILRVLNESAKPFGGKQMIVFGDLFQLPPVAKWQEEKFLTDYYGGVFFFNSNSYSNGRFGFIELTTNHRQKEDKEFFNILNRMRVGEHTEEDIDRLNERHISDRSELRRVITLFPKKAEAERLNNEELAKIEAKEYVYRARVVFNAYNNRTPNLDAMFPFTEELHLKRGALVMMVANDPNKRWVNGTIGIVHTLYDDAIKVTINGTTYDVPLMTFTQREAAYAKGHIEYKEVLSVTQYPVVLAYAITIHKSQGMTYKSIACDITQCFAPGQAYVALSRCSTMSGLYLIKKIYGGMIRANRTAVEFYKSQSSDETIQTFS